MKHREKIAVCLRHFAAKQIPLKVCADPRHLKRKVGTLKAYARALGLRFPDYSPRSRRGRA